MASPKKNTMPKNKQSKKREYKRIASKRTEFKKTTRSSPHPTTMNVIKALHKTRSLNNLTPTPSSSSVKSVEKKPISENLQKKISKKKKREKPLTTPENTQGLKLLKRGCVTMHRIVRRKIMRIKLTVSFNAKGEPFGEEAAEMQSYIGVLARTKPPIWHDTWKYVPNETKTKIWDCVQMAFVVPQSAKKMVLKSACQKWREFKCKLTRDYILPYLDQPEVLAYPPADYSFIEKAHWDIFVADRTSNEFKKIHHEAQERRKLSLYPHRMSRKGYANLENEWSKSHEDAGEVDRSSTWVLARTDKDGNFLSEAIAEKAKEIEKLKEEVKEGKLTVEGVNDVLTMALGNPEHGGRVRGQGTHVKQSVYFDLPRQKKSRTMEEKILEKVQKFMAMETPRIIKERDEYWAPEIAKIRQELSTKTVRLDGSPIPASQQASCQSKGGVDENVGEENPNTPETERKVFPLKHDQVVHKVKLIDNLFVDFGEELNDDDKVVGEDDYDGHVVKNTFEAVKVDDCDNHVSQLAVGSLSNIVAYAKIDEVAPVEGNVQTIHGVKLGENARVSITQVIQGSAKIPFPIGDEIVTVEQALGTFIAWPRDLIVARNNSTTQDLSAPKRTKRGPPKKTKKTFKVIEDAEPEFVVQMGVNYPSALNRLWTWAKDALTDGRTISFELRKEAFGVTKKQVIFLSDIHAVCSGGEMAGSIICIFIHFLNDYVKKYKMSNMISFVDPSTIGAIGCGNASQRSRGLATRFKDAKKGQYFLLPYNDVNHWTLTVVNPDAEVVYYMDPLKRRIANGEWVDVVDNGIKLYKEDLNKVAKKKVLWENMAGIPVQTGNKDCGLFVMSYMKEIVHDKELDFVSKWLRRSNLVYTEDAINEIRTDFAKYFMKRHAV